MANTSMHAEADTPVPALAASRPHEQGEYLPAEITAVSNLDELTAAVRSGARDIEITAHLDLTPIQNPVHKQTAQAQRMWSAEHLLDPRAILTARATTRSLRVLSLRCHCPAAAAAPRRVLPLSAIRECVHAVPCKLRTYDGQRWYLCTNSTAGN